MQVLKQSTTASVVVGPVLDSAGLEYASAVIGDISLSKNGGTLTALASAATLTYIANGHYTLALTTGNTDTLGRADILCNKAGYQVPPVRLTVLAATAFDTLVTNGTLASTTSGRTLDVSAGGEAGIDWANVGSPTTTLALTGTTIATTQKVDLETIKTNPVVNAGTVTFPTTATLASTTNITAGTITTVGTLTTYTGNTPQTGDAYALANSGTFGLAAIKGYVDDIGVAGAGLTALGDTRLANLDATVSSRMATYTQPTGFLAATFPTTVASTTNITAGTITTVGSVTGAVGSVTGNVGGMTAAGWATAFTVDTTKAFADAVEGSLVKEVADGVASGGGTVDANIVSVNGTTFVGSNVPASLTGVTFPTNFSALGISVAGKVTGVVLADTVTTLTNLPTMPTDWVTAAGISAAAVTKVQAGLSTYSGGDTAGTTTLLSRVGSTLTITSGGVTLAAVTHTGAVIPTVTTTGTANVIRTGTAQAGAAGAVTLDSGASTVPGFYNGTTCYLTGGTGTGQARVVTNYNGSTRQASVDRGWMVTPDNTTAFAILAAGSPRLDTNLFVTASQQTASIRNSVIQGATANTATLDSGASTTSGLYTGNLLAIASGVGAGQSRVIVSYNGTTKAAVVDKNWVVTPTSGSAYNIYASTTTSLFSDQGVAQSATASTIVLSSTSSTVDDIYTGSIVTILSGTGAGQTAEITAYVGATHTVTINGTWDVTPNATSAYAVIPTASGTGADPSPPPTASQIAAAILATPANLLATDAQGNVTPADGSITEAKIATPAESAGRPTGVLGMARRLFEWASNKRTRNKTTGVVTLRNSGDTATLESQTQSTVEPVDTQSKGV